MQIDMPKVSFAIGVAVMIETAIGGGTLSLTNMIPPAEIPVVQAWCNALAFVGATVLTGLHAFSGPSTGALASPPTVAQAQQVMAAAKTAAAAILIALLVLWPGHALAQDRNVGPRIKLPIPLPLPNPLTPPLAAPNENAALNALLKPFQDIANFVGNDNLEAAKLSVAIPELQDGNGLACLNAMATYAKVYKAHPLPLTLHVMTDVEAFRLNIAAVNRLCDTAACTVIFADGVNVAQAAAPIAIAGLPSLSQLCAKVAHIQMATPAKVDMDQLNAELAVPPATAPATPAPATPANP